MKYSSFVIALLLLTGCGEDQQPVKESTTSPSAKEVNVEQTTVDKKEVQQVIETPVPAEEPSNTAKVEEKKSVSPVATVEPEPVTTTVEPEPATVTPEPVKTVVESAPGIDAKVLFSKCTGCHGQQAEKSAMNQSAIIKGWETAKTVTALKGYQDGTYGKNMKHIMKGQVSKLSDEEIEALAKYISKL